MTIIFLHDYEKAEEKTYKKKLSKGRVAKDQRGVYAKPNFEIDWYKFFASDVPWIIDWLVGAENSSKIP